MAKVCNTWAGLNEQSLPRTEDKVTLWNMKKKQMEKQYYSGKTGWKPWTQMTVNSGIRSIIRNFPITVNAVFVCDREVF